MPSFESNLELNQNSLLRAVLHPFIEFPNSPTPVPGQVGYNANIGEQRPYFYNGSQWLPFNHIPNGSLTNALWSNSPADRLSFEKLATPTANFDFGNVRLTNLASPVDNKDAVNKAYADAIRETLDFKNSVRVATTGPLPPSTYNNGSGTITANSNGSINTSGIDGITDLTVGSRILVKDQTNQVENGIYTVTQLGSLSTPFILTRAIDANTGTKLTSGSVVYVEEGNVNAKRRFTLVTPGTITLGASNLVFEQSSGLGQVNAGVGLTKTGDTLDVNLTGSNTITAISDSLRVRSSSTQHQVLLSAGSVSSEAVWGALPLNQTNAVSGVLPLSHGGTGATTKTEAFNALAPTTEAGQMIWFDGTNNVAVPPNTTSVVRFLAQASSGQPNWTTPTTSLITSTHNPVNYRPTGTSLEEHIAAIDSAIGVALVSGGITKLIDDLNPTLGGNLNTNNFLITSSDNNDVFISPHGTGRTHIGVIDRRLSIDTNTTNNVDLIATGNDDNININLIPKGAGLLKFNTVTWPTNIGSPGDVLIRQGANQTTFGKLASNQIAANRIPINYTPTGSDLHSHLDAIDRVLGNISNAPFLVVGDANPMLGGDLKLNGYNLVLKEFDVNKIKFGEESELRFETHQGVSLRIRETPIGMEITPYRFVDPSFGDPEDPQFTAALDALGDINLRSNNPFQRIRIEGLAFPREDGLPGQALVTNGLGELSFAYLGAGSSTTINNLGTVVREINTDTNIALITHPFQTQNLIVTVMRTDNFQIVYPEILYTNLNDIRIIFSAPPPRNLYRAIIQAAATVNLRRFFFDINDTENTSIVINHNLGTRDVAIDVFQRVPIYRRVFVEAAATTPNSITLTFSNPPGSNVYRVMVTG
jgi:hypothetical protein